MHWCFIFVVYIWYSREKMTSYNLHIIHGSVFKIKIAFSCVLGALSCFVSSSVPTIPGNSLPLSPCSAQYPCLWWEYWIRCHFISGGCWWALWGELEHIETKAWLLPAFTSTKAKFTRFSCGPLVVLFYFVHFDRFFVYFFRGPLLKRFLAVK